MDIVMPQMGESISSGTITRWLKAPGERVEQDETLFEISTDKVDAEIPSPATGTVRELLFEEGATVDVGAVVARLASGDGVDAGEASMAATGDARVAAAGEKAPASPSPAAAAPVAAEPAAEAGEAGGPAPRAKLATSLQALGELFPSSARGFESAEELRRVRSTPVVRSIAEKHGVRLADVPGTGLSGRVTKRDILAFLEDSGGRAEPAASPAAHSARAAATGPSGPGPFAFNPSLDPLGPSPYPTHGPDDAVEIEVMSPMRQQIARHMAASLGFSAHVTQLIEVDFTEVDRARARLRDSFAARGLKLTYTPFLLRSCARALREFSHFNASVDRDRIIRKRDVNLGLAVALDGGLIVPVIRHADELNLTGLARASEDLASRARARKLRPEEVQGGTFTLTNPGIFGALTGTPVINQPQVAILGVGVIEKRVAVVDDALAIRKRAYVSVTIDHRVLDGADGARFLKFVKDDLESGPYGEG